MKNLLDGLRPRRGVMLLALSILDYLCELIPCSLLSIVSEGFVKLILGTGVLSLNRYSEGVGVVYRSKVVDIY